MRFFALNVWDDSDPVAYFQEHAIGMELLTAADLVAEDYGVRGTPSVFVSDATQRMLYVRQRGDKPANVEQAIRLALDGALTATDPAR